MGKRAGFAMLAFIWIALVYVIVAFTDITAAGFTSAIEELQGVHTSFNPGGAVAAASVMYLLLAVVMGFVQRLLNVPLFVLTLIFVPATIAVAWLGTHVSTLLILDGRTWGLLILVYCAIASLVPVWALLQPRGYLGGFVLFLALALGLVGIFFGGYEVKAEPFRSWDPGGMTGTLFPFLFVTIACGACSGFHGLVCSGTTSKQVESESHMKTVGYGGMLAEGFVAVIALVTIMIVTPGEASGLKPGTIYGNGIGRFLTILIGEENLPFAITFGAMAFSTFVFDTLDVCTRLGRYILQELFGWTTRAGAALATAITIAVPAYILLYAEEGAWVKFWTLFGSSNQLLAALSLLTVSLWLHRAGKRVWFTLIPMLFVLGITLWSLGSLFVANVQQSVGFSVQMINAISAAALILLALYLVLHALLAVRRDSRSRPADFPLT
jgi:carbon starvation protein